MCYLANEAEYKIVKMTMNEKYYPKRARFIITNKLIESAMNVSSNFNQLFIEDWRYSYEQAG